MQHPAAVQSLNTINTSLATCLFKTRQFSEPEIGSLYEPIFCEDIGSPRVRAGDVHKIRPSPAYPGASGPAHFGTVAEPKARMRMQRWRGRWGGKIGTVRLREKLPLGESRSKAGHQIGSEKRDQKWAQILSPKMGAQIVITIGKMYRSRNLSPFLGSDSEPKNGFGKWVNVCPIWSRVGSLFSAAWVVY